MKPKQLPFHPRFRAPAVPASSPAGERIKELEDAIELLGVALVRAIPPASQRELRRQLEEVGNVAWSRSQPKAAEILRGMAAKIPKADGESPF